MPTTEIELARVEGAESRSVQLQLQADGAVRLHAYDKGATARLTFDRDEYEFWVTVPAEAVEHQKTQEQSRLLGDMLGRSATDQQFRSLMLTDAHAAFAQYGVNLPESYDIVFIENKFDATFVLPEALDELVELEEAELMTVNGGATPLSAIGTVLQTSKSLRVPLSARVLSDSAA